MGLEAATFIHQLNSAWPLGAADPVAQGDDHIRMIKSALQATFANITGAVTATHTQLNNAGASGITGFAIAANKIKGSGVADAGAATTALRSDVQILIDLADTYAWSNQHTYSKSGHANSAAIVLASADPAILFSDTNNGANAKHTEFISNGNLFAWGIIDDTYSNFRNAVQFLRAANSVVSLTFGNATDNPTYSFSGSGAATFGGTISAAPAVFALDVAVNTKIQSINSTSSGMVGTQSNHPLEIRTNNTIRATYAADGSTLTNVPRLLGPDGALGTPAFSYSLDNDTGFYRGATGDTRYAADGVLSWIVRANGSFFIDGVASAPGIGWIQDPDTGFYRFGSGDVRFSSNNSDVFEMLPFASGGAKVADFGGTYQVVGFREIPQNSQSANYTAVLADSGKHLLHPNGAGAGDTFTIPANGSVAYALGTALTFVNRDSNSLSIAITTDTLILAGSTTTGTRTLAQNGVATAIKVEATTWIISGSGLS